MEKPRRDRNEKERIIRETRKGKKTSLGDC
jgi:hypothetical protein